MQAVHWYLAEHFHPLNNTALQQCYRTFGVQLQQRLGSRNYD